MDLEKPSQDSAPTLLVTELWGLGDLALAVPFLRAAAKSMHVTLVAKSHAAPILERFAPNVKLVKLDAPWTAFRGKYRLHRWPWGVLGRTLSGLRELKFDVGVSARPDPRDHFLLALAGARRRYGFPRAGSRLLLNKALPPPSRPHRSAHWASLAAALEVEIDSPDTIRRSGRRVLIHTGAGQPTRRWPVERYLALAASLDKAGWRTEVIDDSFTGIAPLLDKISKADRFIGNDSGPGHLATLLGVPTFTVFGPQLPELFAPQGPDASWIDGAPCPFKPCRDYCRFAAPNCINSLEFETVLARTTAWIGA